jgi:hypothetical protein
MPLSAPYDFDSPSSSSSAATRRLAVGNRLDGAALGDVGVVLVGHDHQPTTVSAEGLDRRREQQRLADSALAALNLAIWEEKSSVPFWQRPGSTIL